MANPGSLLTKQCLSIECFLWLVQQLSCNYYLWVLKKKTSINHVYFHSNCASSPSSNILILHFQHPFSLSLNQMSWQSQSYILTMRSSWPRALNEEHGCQTHTGSIFAVTVCMWCYCFWSTSLLIISIMWKPLETSHLMRFLIRRIITKS